MCAIFWFMPQIRNMNLKCTAVALLLVQLYIQTFSWWYCLQGNKSNLSDRPECRRHWMRSMTRSPCGCQTQQTNVVSFVQTDERTWTIIWPTFTNQFWTKYGTIVKSNPTIIHLYLSPTANALGSSGYLLRPPIVLWGTSSPEQCVSPRSYFREDCFCPGKYVEIKTLAHKSSSAWKHISSQMVSWQKNNDFQKT